MNIIRPAILAVFVATPSIAQEPAPSVQPPANVATPPAQPVLLAPAQSNVVRAGTEVVLSTREEITTKKKAARVGQRIQMEVSEAIRLNDVIVVPVGTPAVAEITEVRNKGMWGKSGYIGARIVSMRVGDRHIRLSGNFDDKGVTGTGGVVAAIAFVPIAGFFTTGTSAMIPSGSQVKGFLDEDIVLASVPVVQPAIVAVPASPAPVAVPAALPVTSVPSTK